MPKKMVCYATIAWLQETSISASGDALLVQFQPDSKLVALRLNEVLKPMPF